MMKNLASLFFLLICLTSFGWAQSFLSDINEARTLSQTEQKPIMLVFSGSDWCKPCILMKKEILSTPTFQEFSEANLVVVNLDFPFRKKNELPAAQKAHNEQLAEKYNPEGAFPMVVILDEDESVAQRIHYKMNMSPQAFIDQIKMAEPQ